MEDQHFYQRGPTVSPDSPADYSQLESPSYFIATEDQSDSILPSLSTSPEENSDFLKETLSSRNLELSQQLYSLFVIKVITDLWKHSLPSR